MSCFKNRNAVDTAAPLLSLPMATVWLQGQLWPQGHQQSHVTKAAQLPPAILQQARPNLAKCQALSQPVGSIIFQTMQRKEKEIVSFSKYGQKNPTSFTLWVF